MANFGLMALATLVASFLASYAHLADTGHSGAQSNDLPALEQEKIETYMPSICSQTTLSHSPATSVHALRPSDIAVVSGMGIPLTQRTEAYTAVSRLSELVSMFNPEVTNLPWDHKASQQHRSLLEEAEALASSLFQLRAGDRDWKLVLLFVPVEALCACSQQVAEEVETVVQQVEAALQILYLKLRHTLVHVVVWSGHPQMEMSYRCMRDYSKGKLQLLRANLIKIMQDSLEKHLTGLRWVSEEDDFTVMLQPIPLVPELVPQLEEGTFSDSNQLAIQLWTNLLQPMMGQEEVKDNSIINVPCPDQEHPFLRTQRNSVIHNQQAGQAFLKTGGEDAAFIDPVMGSELPCKDRAPSPSTPTSVHEVRPGDIKVVAALGDSLTAANGVGAKADNLLLVLNEYRGLSWDIGGDENLATVTTLPNILREFNPLLTGYSQGIGDETSPQAFLNQAVPGATSSDVTTQVQVLVDKMKNDLRIDYENDWKVITMFIGGNDLCDFCSDAIHFSTNNFVGRIQEALDILHREVPRAIVNLVEPLDLVALREVHKEKSLGCPTWFVNLLCRCVLKPVDGSLELQKLQDLNRDYQLGLRQLVDSGRYDTHTNFSVVLQPFFREVILPLLEDGRPDRSYFSPDCFHLSQKAHTLMAVALWNNMLEPVGNKTYTQDFSSGIDLKCPSPNSPYLRTAHNSNYTYPPPPPVPPPVTNWGSEFSCMNTAPSNTVPTSVHKLKPGDIKVVAALGDSLTAGFGAKATNLIQLSTEYRGVSWSIGGDKSLDTVTTLPNILKKFNPNIKGMSKGQGTRQTGFNVAVSGAKIAGIPGQVRRLIDTMKNDTTVDFQNDWKLVTLFIGGNDLCQYCNDRAALSPKNYSRYMMESLDVLYKEVPRVMVNVLEILQIEGLRRVKRESLGCSLLQKNVCPCFLIPGEDSLELAEIKRINRELQTETENLVNGARYNGREDFTVVLQPFFQNSVVPVNAEGKADSTYFSVDCFHFSERGHADMAVALWNNMFEPMGEKQTYNNFTNDRNRIKCPTAEHPYIFTSVNSVPSVPMTTTTTTPTTTTVPPAPMTTAIPFNPTCSDNVPAWAAAVLAVTGLLIGWGITWFILSLREKNNRRKMQSVVEMKGTGF